MAASGQAPAAWPGYAPPPPHARGAPLRPDAFAMSLLPAAAQPYVAAPLQALMAPDHPLAEVYHATPPPVWRAELASRIRRAVEAVPAEAYSAEEREAIATGRVRAFGLVRESAHLAASGVRPNRYDRTA